MNSQILILLNAVVAMQLCVSVVQSYHCYFYLGESQLVAATDITEETIIADPDSPEQSEIIQKKLTGVVGSGGGLDKFNQIVDFQCAKNKIAKFEGIAAPKFQHCVVNGDNLSSYTVFSYRYYGLDCKLPGMNAEQAAMLFNKLQTYQKWIELQPPSKKVMHELVFHECVNFGDAD